MGATLVPLAASGQPAPITLVEVATKGYVSPPTDPAGVIPPAPPRALAAGESMAWAYSQTKPAGEMLANMTGTYGIASFTRTNGSMIFYAGNPLGPNTLGGVWGDFLQPAAVPPGFVITEIIPVLVALDVTGDSSWQSPGFGPVVPSVGVNVGTSISSLAGATISAQYKSTTPGAGGAGTFTVGFVGFAFYYKESVVADGSPGADADSALARSVYFWSERRANWPSIITGKVEQFLDWITQPPVFRIYGSTQTDKATIVIQNISGNTVDRDAMKAFVETELNGALVVARLWRGDAEQQLMRFIGNISGVQVHETSLEITVDGFGNWSAITAPSYDIDPSCPLTFASPACASTSPTPCDQTWGTCSSLNRFAGVLTGWIMETPNVQLAQPAPAVIFNPKRPF